jgi:hypothetical protein
MSNLTRGIRSKSPPPFSKGGPGGISEICYHFAHNFISKRLGFFRDWARKKWPLRGSEKPEIPPTPLCKGGQGGIYREYTGFFLLTNMLVLVWR